MPARSAWLVLLAGLACAHNPAPAGMLPAAEDLEVSPYGSYILVRQKNGAEIGGELLVVLEGEVRVRGDRGVRAIPERDIESMRLAVYQTGQGVMGIWGLVGTLSTLSHGFVLILSAPVWIIGTSVSAAVESRAALVDYPDQPLRAFARFARYPQGLPVAARPSWTAPPPAAVAPPPPGVPETVQ
jgi:hypothetical protein